MHLDTLPFRRAVASLALGAALAAGPLAPAAHAAGTKAQCDAVRALTSISPDPTLGSKKAKAELTKLKAAEAKVPAKLKADAKKVRAFWEAIVKWQQKYPDPAKAMMDPKGLADYGRLMEKVSADVTPAIQRVMGWSMMECLG